MEATVKEKETEMQTVRDDAVAKLAEYKAHSELAIKELDKQKGEAATALLAFRREAELSLDEIKGRRGEVKAAAVLALGEIKNTMVTLRLPTASTTNVAGGKSHEPESWLGTGDASNKLLAISGSGEAQVGAERSSDGKAFGAFTSAFVGAVRRDDGHGSISIRETVAAAATALGPW